MKYQWWRCRKVTNSRQIKALNGSIDSGGLESLTLSQGKHILLERFAYSGNRRSTAQISKFWTSLLPKMVNFLLLTWRYMSFIFEFVCLPRSEGVNWSSFADVWKTLRHNYRINTKISSSRPLFIETRGNQAKCMFWTVSASTGSARGDLYPPRNSQKTKLVLVVVKLEDLS